MQTKHVDGCRARRSGGLAGQASQGLTLDRRIAVLAEQLEDDIRMDADGAIVAWVHPRGRLGAGGRRA